jgi:hypothetical protein
MPHHPEGISTSDPDIPQGKTIKTYPIADTGGAILTSLERVYQRNNDARTRVTDSMPESNSTAAQAHNMLQLRNDKKKKNKDSAYPLTLIFAGSTPRTFSTIRTTTENASLTSHKAMSSAFKPALSRAMGTATVGASGKCFGSTPPSAYAVSQVSAPNAKAVCVNGSTHK